MTQKNSKINLILLNHERLTRPRLCEKKLLGPDCLSISMTEIYRILKKLKHTAKARWLDGEWKIIWARKKAAQYEEQGHVINYFQQWYPSGPGAIEGLPVVLAHQNLNAASSKCFSTHKVAGKNGASRDKLQDHVSPIQHLSMPSMGLT